MTPARYKLGYARVSTEEQHLELQLDALKTAGCDQIAVEKISTRSARRPELDRLIERTRPGDALVVWKLDRFGRSLQDLIERALDLKERGVQFISLTDAIDTTTASGMFFFNIMGAAAQFERDIISERTRAGLAAAAARGKKGGRPRALTPVQQHAMLAMQQRGLSRSEIAAAFGNVSISTVKRALAVAKEAKD